MGGDHGLGVTVPASFLALRRDTDLRIILVGRESELRPLIASALREFGERLQVQDATDVISMDERPQDALRKKKNSSMRVAI
ncbi:MAG: phosphate acyltransferase, partial [Candidatus Obscuribacterales bacterium]|nr:phosphate acyltransferase [Steroidobacteraceae bacterium]